MFMVTEQLQWKTLAFDPCYDGYKSQDMSSVEVTQSSLGGVYKLETLKCTLVNVGITLDKKIPEVLVLIAF